MAVDKECILWLSTLRENLGAIHLIVSLLTIVINQKSLPKKISM